MVLLRRIKLLWHWRSALHQLLGPLQSDNGGVDLDDASIERCLEALDLAHCNRRGMGGGDTPSRRQDLHREVDLIEEVARLVGFDRFKHLPDPLQPGALTPRQQAERRLRRLLFCRPRSPTLSLVPSSETESASRSAICCWRIPVTCG